MGTSKQNPGASTQNTSHRRQVDSVLQVLDKAKNNKQWYDERGLIAGYHTVNVGDTTLKGQRNPEKRLAKIDYDFRGKRVLDVGCSNGGVLHALADQVAFAVGVDFNTRCINAANVLKAVNQSHNLHFYTFDLDNDDLNMLGHLVLGETVDVCLFFNISLWVKRWQSVFRICSSLTTTMLFESHGTEDEQAEQLAFVRTIYNDITLISSQSDDDPTYSNRKMYICRHTLCEQLANESAEVKSAATLHHGADDLEITRAYQQAFGEQPVKALKRYPRTQESVVTLINDEYVVKFPLPGRGLAGIETEQKVTSLIRTKVDLSLPVIDVKTQPLAMARYRKLPGVNFDFKRYDQLSDSGKQKIAKQLANFINALHGVTRTQLIDANIELSPSWHLKPALIEQQLKAESDEVIQALLSDTLNIHRHLNPPEEHLVFGHFDLHGGNVLFNEQHNNIVGIIDFGNCKIGDLHQELSVMNLSSRDLAHRIAINYEAASGRKLNHLLIQHYTTMFYLNLLAGLKSAQNQQKYDHWLTRLHHWYGTSNRSVTSNARANAQTIQNLPFDWRLWLASNLMKNQPKADLVSIMSQHGFSSTAIDKELQQAEEHPYIKAGHDIALTLNKRNWLLNAQDEIAKSDPGYHQTIEEIEAPDFTEFIRRYYSKNLPVKLKGGVSHWPAIGKWNENYLLQHYGHKDIEIQDDRENDPLFERNSISHKKKMSLAQFISMIVNGGSSNNYYMTANNTQNSFAQIRGLFDDLGDFADGYRNMNNADSSTFFWFGPKGTFTPIHFDLSNIMLVQIYGRKKVTLIPANQMPHLYNDKGVFSAATYPKPDINRHPLMARITPVEITLAPGDALFIPIGWWHCVTSLDISISISFTNFNAPNQFSKQFPKG